MKKSKFIVIEGVDGAGKSTQIQKLKDFLEEKGVLEEFVFVRDPGGTDAGSDIRKVILGHDMSSKTEALLFYASRQELLKQKIIPALKEGKNVIGDRYELTTFAYQIYGREKEENRNLIDCLQKEISLIPDKYYFFDLDAKISKNRTDSRDRKNNRLDDEDVNFFNRARYGYKKELLKYDHKILDASKSIEEVAEEFIEDFSNFMDI